MLRQLGHGVSLRFLGFLYRQAVGCFQDKVGFKSMAVKLALVCDIVFLSRVALDILRLALNLISALKQVIDLVEGHVSCIDAGIVEGLVDLAVLVD